MGNSGFTSYIRNVKLHPAVFQLTNVKMDWKYNIFFSKDLLRKLYDEGFAFIKTNNGYFTSKMMNETDLFSLENIYNYYYCYADKNPFDTNALINLAKQQYNNDEKTSFSLEELNILLSSDTIKLLTLHKNNLEYKNLVNRGFAFIRGEQLLFFYDEEHPYTEKLKEIYKKFEG